MIIGVDIREWQPGRRTGIGRFLEEFLRSAAAARPSDRFLLVGNTASEARLLAANVELIRVGEPWTAWWDQVSLPRVLARRGADVFYSPYIKVPLLAPVPLVSTIHDLTYLVPADWSRPRGKRLVYSLFRLFCHLVVRRAAAVMVDSETTARDVQRLFRPTPGRVRVVPLATAAAFRSDADPQADEAVWRRYALSPGYVFYLGGFRPHKNVPRLVRAHAELQEPLRTRHPLVLAGGPLTDELRRLLGEPRMAGAIRYLGVIPDQDLPALYRGCVLFAFPSRAEGFGLPVLEAMACGVPVLCSTAPALMELAAGCAEHVPPEDGPGWARALCALLGDPQRRQDLGRRGRSRAAAFTRERMTGQILQVLAEVARCP